MKVRPSALILKDNKVLTLKYTYPNGIIYALPGGNLEFGEELKFALERELVEELNINAQLGDIITIAEVIFEECNTIHFVFSCLSYSGEPQINPQETKAEEIAWLPFNEIADYTLYPNIGKALSEDKINQFLGEINQPRY